MVSVDKDKCIGCGLCTSMAPDVFKMDADGKAKAYKQMVDENVRTAAESCPVGAITV